MAFRFSSATIFVAFLAILLGASECMSDMPGMGNPAPAPSGTTLTSFPSMVVGVVVLVVSLVMFKERI